MSSHALVLEPVDPIELSLAFGGARAPESGLLLTPATRIILELDWDGAALTLAAGSAQLGLELAPYVCGGGGSGNSYFPGGW